MIIEWYLIIDVNQVDCLDFTNRLGLSAPSSSPKSPPHGRNSRKKASQMWWQKLGESIIVCRHSAMASLPGGIFHLRKIDPERRDLFFNEVST